MRIKTPGAVALTLTTMLLGAACGSDAKPAASGSVTGRLCDAAKANGKPEVHVPAAPVTELNIHDDKVGTGATVGPDSTVTVNYIGCGQASGKQFDSSWDSGEPATFSVTGVIKGWTDGLQGMKVGGRRTLTIPGEQAYQAAGKPPIIGPNETLVFTIDLISIA